MRATSLDCGHQFHTDCDTYSLVYTLKARLQEHTHTHTHTHTNTHPHTHTHAHTHTHTRTHTHRATSLDCGHSFHTDCVVQWLGHRLKSSLPVCICESRTIYRESCIYVATHTTFLNESRTCRKLHIRSGARTPHTGFLGGVYIRVTNHTSRKLHISCDTYYI